MTRVVKHCAFFVTKTQESVLKNPEPSAWVTKPFTCCAVVCVCVCQRKQPTILQVFTHTRSSHFPPSCCPSAALLSSLTFSRFHNTLFKGIPFSGVSAMSGGLWKPKSAAFQRRFISPHLPTVCVRPLHQHRSTSAASKQLCCPWTLTLLVQSTRVSSIPLDLKAFTSHHEARNQQRNPPGLL